MPTERIIDRSESQLEPQTGLAAVGPSANGLAHTGQSLTAMDILARAVESGRSADELGKLIDLADRMATMGAAREFAAAKARFKATCPQVPRRSENPYFQVTRNGVKKSAMFASLEDIEATVGPHLAANGLSYRWSDSKIDGGRLVVSCVLTHAGGHSESATVTYPLESKAGGSEQQKLKGVKTFAKRDSLEDVLGITTCEDNDGNDNAEPETITAHQAANLDAECDELGVDRTRILTFAGVDSFADIPAAKWSAIRAKMDEKRASLKRGGK